MIEKLIQLLSENEHVTDYRINTTKTESYETFFVHKSLETVRSTHTTDTSVTVYADHDGKKGNADFSVYASDTDEIIRQKIETAAQAALVIHNENYQLPECETLSAEIPSNMAGVPLKKLAAQTADAVFAADRYADGSINALEIFINHLTLSVYNSRGLHKSESKYSAMIEAIPTWNADGQSVELYEAYHFSDLEPEKITAEIDRRMQEVRDRQLAVKPESSLTCPVVLRSHELSGLFYDLTSNLNYAAVYAHSNAYQLGDQIQATGDGDPLTITMRHSLPGSSRSALFDTDGVTLQDTLIIRNGQAIANFGASRFAQYLSQPVTGNLGCMEIQPGTLTEEELHKAPYFECVSMSALQVDVYNDYIGGEVRLAYYYDGQKLIPLTDVSISGKLSEALKSMRLSNLATVRDSYEGPDRALFHNISIL